METPRHTIRNRLTHLICFFIFLAALHHELLAASVGTTFTYQGRLASGGQPANGTYDLRLILYDAEAGGSQVGPMLTNAAVNVAGGLFTTTLDFGAGVFTGQALWMEIAVRSNSVGGFTLLSPRQPLTVTPQALYAASAPVADGAVTGAKIADSAVTGAKIADGTVVNADLAPDAVTSSKVLNGTLTGSDMADNTVGSAQLADTIALGSSSVAGQLDVFRTAAGTPAISLMGNNSQISTFGSDGLEQVRLWGVGWGELFLFNDRTDNAIGAALSANSSAGGYLQLNNTNGAARARLEGLNTGGTLSLWANDGSLGLSLTNTTLGGTMFLHDSAGVATVQLRGDGGGRIDAAGGFHLTTGLGGLDQVLLSRSVSGGRSQTFDEFGHTTSTLGSSSVGGGYLYLYQSNGVITVNLDGDATGANGGGSLALAGTNNVARVNLFGHGSGGGGEIRLGNTNGGMRLSLFGQGGNGSGEINVMDASGTETIEILGQQSSLLGSRITLRQSSGVASMILNGEYGNAAEGSAIILNNGFGNPRLLLEGDSFDAGYVGVYGTNGATKVILNGNASGRGRVSTEELQVYSATVTVSAGETLVPGPNYMRISGGAGNTGLSPTISIANGSAIGTMLILEGTSDSAQVTVYDNANTRLNANRILGANDTLTLIWNGVDWLELSYSIN